MRAAAPSCAPRSGSCEVHIRGLYVLTLSNVLSQPAFIAHANCSKCETRPSNFEERDCGGRIFHPIVVSRRRMLESLISGTTRTGVKHPLSASRAALLPGFRSGLDFTLL